MEGAGLLQDTEAPHPHVHSFGSQERWALAREPLHDLAASPQPVHTRLMAEAGQIPPSPERRRGAGLGLTFGRLMAERTGMPVGLIPCARGSTSMQQWSPQQYGPQPPLYAAMLARIRACGGKIAGVLWYQGESDVGPDDWPHYEERMTTLLSALRRDLDQPTLPFLMVQLGRFVSFPVPVVVRGWNELRERQRCWANAQTNVEIVAALDLELSDAIHLDTPGLRRLGKRLAKAAQGQSGLQPDRLHDMLTPLGGPGLRLTLSGVTQELHAGGRPLGFGIYDVRGQRLPLIYRIELQGNAVALHLTEPLPAGATLGYGLGLDPVVNLVDRADQALLSFSGLRPQAPEGERVG